MFSKLIANESKAVNITFEEATQSVMNNVGVAYFNKRQHAVQRSGALVQTNFPTCGEPSVPAVRSYERLILKVAQFFELPCKTRMLRLTPNRLEVYYG